MLRDAYAADPQKFRTSMDALAKNDASALFFAGRLESLEAEWEAFRSQIEKPKKKAAGSSSDVTLRLKEQWDALCDAVSGDLTGQYAAEVAAKAGLTSDELRKFIKDASGHQPVSDAHKRWIERYLEVKTERDDWIRSLEQMGAAFESSRELRPLVARRAGIHPATLNRIVTDKIISKRPVRLRLAQEYAAVQNEIASWRRFLEKLKELSRSDASLLPRLAEHSGLSPEHFQRIVNNGLLPIARDLADQYLLMERGEIIRRGAGADMDRDGVRELLSV